MVSYRLRHGLEPGLKAPVWWPEGLWPVSSLVWASALVGKVGKESCCRFT